MSGELQTIPARHGTATFVPKGHTIKIMNIYGTQVIDAWAFALHKTPGEEEEDQKKALAQKGDEKKSETKKSAPRKLDRKASEQKKSTPPAKSEEDAKKDAKEDPSTEKQVSPKTDEDQASKPKEAGESASEEKKQPGDDKTSEVKSDEDASAKDKPADGSADKDKADKEADEKADAAMSKSWTSYLPSLRSKKSKGDVAESKPPAEKEAKKDEKKEEKKDEKKEESKATQEDNKASESTSKGWSSYIPSGKAFSSYLPSKSTLSAFAASHYRDPNKSYAEQLYDFSKTPVGAASLSAATGSGTPGVLYAAYSAYQKEHASKGHPPMEYLSMPHTRASTQHLTPKVNDTLVSNLRAPLLTLIEDTSPGVHDTLIAACDPQRYKELGVEKWEEHGSCAENLVVALKELNDKSGLKGPKSVGADVTVNMVPAPLNLFMNIPWTQDGNISFEAPVSKRGDYVKFRAERDVVVVMSACPQDVLNINKKKPMAARFMVEEPKDEDSKQGAPKEEGAKEEGGKTEEGKAEGSKGETAEPQLTKKPSEQAKPPLTKKPSEQTRPSPSKRPSEQAKPPLNNRPSEQARPPLSNRPSEQNKTSLEKKPSEQTQPPSEKKPSEQPSKPNGSEAAPAQEEPKQDPSKEKKKPKKLEKRSGGATPVKSAS